MQIKTFNEILTELCDNFDTLISPRTIARTNTNIIYLIFKAVAKGYEVINNVCVALSNKFDPATCSSEDLNSVAELVGTKKLSGSASGLYITVTNGGASSATLLGGYYYYSLDEDTRFKFEVLGEGVEIGRGETKTFFAFSEEIGRFPVSAQLEITVDSDMTIPSGFSFACSDNSALLGSSEETDAEFRQRILTDTTRQDSISELQTALHNLPYIFDTRIYFNNTLEDVTYDGITIPPYEMAVFFSGDARPEMAGVVARYGIYPTVQTPTSVTLDYMSEAFAEGKYSIYVIPFKTTDYKVRVNYKVDSVYNDKDAIETAIKEALMVKMNGQIHKDFVNEADIYNEIQALNIAGASILNVDLLVNDVAVPYVEVPLSRIPKLLDVTFPAN